MADPVIVTCAVSGGVITGNPNQPHTRDDVISAAIGAREAGASLVHIHARTVEGGISQDPEDYREIKAAVLGGVDDLVLNFTTGGQLGMPDELRRRSLEAQPDVASLNCGSLNFGPDGAVFLNPPALINALAREMDERRIVREYECFDFGMAVTAERMIRSAPGAPGMMHLVLGVVGGAPASVESVSMFAQMVPRGLPWMVTAVGRPHFPMIAVTIARGGHVRTGLEDVVYTAAREYAPSNAALVERAVTLCEAIGRPVATPAQTRELLRVPARDRSPDETGR